MRAGFSRRDITPPEALIASGQVPLAGYGVTRAAAGVHDRLYARALALLSRDAPPENRAVVLLVLDVLFLDNVCMDAIYRGAAAFGLPPDRLLVNCIHTHSSFGGIFDNSRGVNRAMTALLGAASPALIELLVSGALAAVKDAIGDAENAPEASLRAAWGELEGLGTNRHDPDIESDRRVLALELISGGRKILLYQASCHPTVMNADNLRLSADVPGAAAAELERNVDGVIVVNGAA
ncbi:MAG: neutral/alkaline non-lysosomal ceramidase N-terminal domain-containing protein, partial [Treponema sp.]|nr:neutral/alkaline non-lysosomal ceramidase N-terminal domain-containing protein [Treponema sp.]